MTPEQLAWMLSVNKRERAKEIHDKARALVGSREQDAWQHRQWREQHRDRYGILDMGEPTEVEPTPPPPPRQTSQLTDAQILRLIDDRIAKSSIAPQVNEALAIIAKALDNLHKMIELDEKKIVELREEVAGLRADQTVMRTINANRNVFGVVRKEARSDVA